MQLNAAPSTSTDADLAVNDLGPLAWVLDELRKSLDGAAKALKRFVRDAEAARGSDLEAIDASQLRIARQQLHQAVGALEMVGLPGPALLLRAMEAAVQRFIQHPDQCGPDAAARIERASFALTEYLEGVLADKPISPVSLFPQYRDVQELVRADRIHPADLWPFEWRWLEPQAATPAPAPRSYDTTARALLDPAVLQLMKGKAPQAARQLKELSLAFAAAQADRQPRIFWQIAAAYFEAVGLDLLPADLYVRRAASRILLQYASLAKGDSAVSDRLAQDLLFFCAQAVASRAQDAPALSAVRTAYGLTRFRPVDYEVVQFGRFDPALLAQARKRIASAKETWSSLSAGDTTKFKLVVDQFSLVSDSLLKLHPASDPLAQALHGAVDMTARAAQTPPIELAIEVATAILYLEAVFDDLDPSDPQLAERTTNLADRLDRVRAGGEAQPLQPWMEELYRRVSDKQTMGSVVGELRISLGDIEKSLDVFFRDPTDKTALQAIPGQLSQMRGVLSVLGLDQASHAVARMKDCVEQMLTTEIDEQAARAAGTFENLGNNLGALSFLIDMLNYQPTLAKKLFVYDEEKGELKPLMGRTQPALASSVTLGGEALALHVESAVQEAGAAAPGEDLSEKFSALATHAALAEQPALAQSARAAAAALLADDADAAAQALTSLASAAAPVHRPNDQVAVDFEEDDLLDIFLEEAGEVIGNAREALAALVSDAADMSQLTILRRAFHTLKGSSRMVGLNAFGEAGWSLEQLLNSWLADQKPASPEFLTLCGGAVDGFAQWVEAIAAKQDGAWASSAFRHSADALRIEGRYSPLALTLPETPSMAALSLQDGPVAVDALPAFDDVPLAIELLDVPVPAAASAASAPAVLASDFEFDLNFGDSAAVPAAGAAQGSPESWAPLPVSSPADGPVRVLEIEGIDFASLAALSPVEPASAPPEAVAAPLADETGAVLASMETLETVEMSAEDFDEHFNTGAAPLEATVEVPRGEADAPATALEDGSALLAEPVAEEILDFATLEPVVEPGAEQGVVQADAMPAVSTAAADEPVDDAEDQIKVIGDLRIGFPLYNVYLNEADEWSRRLVTEVAEWALERREPVSDSTVALAHSLAGSSATVGFKALSEMARALEHALQQAQAHHSRSMAEYAPVFVNAAEDIRRLLHQFAAGFLKQPDADLLDQLRHLEFSDSLLPSASEFADAADADAALDALLAAELPPVVQPAPLRIATAVAPPARLYTPPVVAVSHSQDDDEEIDAIDAIDPDLFPIFEEEANELMPQLGSALRQWSARPENLSARMEVLRALHTLKGSARLAGAMRLGEMAHKIESEIEFLGSDAAASQQFEPLLTRFDAMQATFDRLRHGEPAAPAASAEAQGLAAVSGEHTAPLASTAAPLTMASSVQRVRDESAANESSGRKLAVPGPQAMAMQPVRQAASATIRVRSQLLDRMVNQAGEVMITRSRLEAELGQLRGSLNDMSGNLNRLRQQLRDIELQAETQMQSRLAQAKEAQAGFDPLEFDRFTRVQELTRMMAESVNDVATVQRTLQRTVEATEDDLIAQARQTRELQRDLLRTRMVEFEGISERLYRVVRQASKDSGKQVRLDLLGGTIEMDRGMLDRMTPAFEHLLRNCVAHGIESPQVRSTAGKDAVGLITVHLRQEGNDVSVDFSDDGAGLDLQRIRDKAISLGLLQPEQSLSDQEAANLIFMPGFSTATQVTELAGRGIGMDVVRAEVNALGGRIETSTVAGQGTHFKLVLPLTTAVTQVVMVRAGNQSVGVPSNLVETVRRATAKELQQAYNSGILDVAGEAVPFFWGGALLQASRQSAEAQGKTTPVVIFRSAAQRLALHVDEVLGNQEVVVKNLGPQLSRLPGLAGMSVLASGAVVLIYNPVALVTVYGPQARAWSADQAEPHILEEAGNAAKAPPLLPAVPQIPLILVVDDSITVRRVTQRLLQREGYRVAMAADGLQALERLQEERPAVVLSDIEMPRMDGFDLARNIRADMRLSGLPIIMITSRIAEKHREHARELGVDHYLGKPYSEEELMSLVRHYCASQVAVAA